MQRVVNTRRVVGFLFLMMVITSGASLVLGQSVPLNPKDFESNSLLFVQQDVLPSFGQQTGVRLGTVKGLISGAITTNFSFAKPLVGGPFEANDSALIIDPDGDQILFEVHSEGTVTGDTLSGAIIPFRAPFLATYKVVNATGKLSKYMGLVFPARGTGVISSLVAIGQVTGAPVGIVYSEVSRNPMHK